MSLSYLPDLPHVLRFAAAPAGLTCIFPVRWGGGAKKNVWLLGKLVAGLAVEVHCAHWQCGGLPYLAI